MRFVKTYALFLQISKQYSLVASWLLLSPQRSLRLLGLTCSHRSAGGLGGSAWVATRTGAVKGPTPMPFTA